MSGKSASAIPMPQVPMVDPRTGFPTIPWYQYFVSPLIADLNLSGATTDDLAEGEKNLYFSSALSFAALKSQLQQGQNISLLVNDQNQTITISAIGQAFVADNTAQIGLTRIEGVSPYAMRSDGAPPLNQGINPTWTGSHTFNLLITGSISGNAGTATLLQTARTIGVSGITGTAQSFNGSANITIAITAIPTSLFTGILQAAQFPALTGAITTTAGSIATTLSASAVALSNMANLAATSLIGNSSASAATPAAIGIGSGLSLSGGVLSATGSGGTVMSVGLAAPVEFTISGSPVTTSGTLTFTKANQNANLVWAGPSSGSAAAPTFRGLVASDIPALSYVTSVGLSLPAIFTISGSPVTSTGTLTAVLATQTANTFWMGPSSGSAAAPTFRAPALADIGVALPNGYIDGLGLVWNSATSISAMSGNAFLPNGTFLNVSSTITLSGLSLTASTFYHVYLYNNSGTPAIECVTTAPASPYSGTARAKTSDTSRRYLGSVLTDSSGNVIGFTHSATLMLYQNVGLFSFLVNGGLATTSTVFSCSTQVPVVATAARLQIGNGDTTQTVRVGISAITSTNFSVTLPASENITADVPLTSSQQAAYAYGATPTAGVFIRATGYIFSR